MDEIRKPGRRPTSIFDTPTEPVVDKIPTPVPEIQDHPPIGRKKAGRKKKSIFKFLALFLSILSIGILVYMYITVKQTTPPPLPKDAVAGLSFKIYYPTRMPQGYQFKKGSITALNGLLFYKFENDKKIITVSEQVAPPKSFKLSSLEGYTSITVPAGKAATGKSVGNPSVIILTDTTLINITSSKGVSKDTVISFAQKMNLFVPPDSL